MKRKYKIAAFALLFSALAYRAYGDTPAPGTVGIRGGTDNTAIGNVADALKVTGTFSPSGTTTVVQPTASLLNVTVGNFPSLFPVTQNTSPWVVSGSLGRTWNLLNTTDSVNVGNFPSTQAVTGAFFQATQPVSVVSLPLPTNASQESGGHLASIDTKLTSPLTTNATLQAGTSNIGHVDGQGTAGSPSGGVLTIQGVSGGQVLPISGTISGSGNFTVVQPTGSNLHADIDNFPATQVVSQATASNLNATAVTTGGATIAKDSSLTTINTTLGFPFQAGGSIGNTSFQATQATAANLNATVVGTVTVNAGTNLNTSALALSSNQTNGTQKSQTVDGSGNVWGPNVTLSGTNYFPVVQASSGTPGSAVPARSTVIAGSDGTNARTISTDTSGNQNVNVVNTPTVTANAGTNLNTSLLALQSGVNQNLDTKGSGTITSGASTITATSNGSSTCTFIVSGTWSANLIVTGTSNGTTSALLIPFSPAGAQVSGLITANGTYVYPAGGFGTLVFSAFTYTSGTATVNWECSSGVNSNFVGLATASSSSSTVGSFSLGQSTGKTTVMKAANLNTTAVTANQTILTYTVTAGKTLYLEYFDCSANTGAAAVTASAFGTCSLSINGTIVYTNWYHGSGTAGPFPIHLPEPIAVPAGQVILLETTPFAATSFLWYANFGGYEK